MKSQELSSACAPLCCKSMCCASPFLRGWWGSCGQQIQTISEGPYSKMLVQGNNLRFRDQGGSRGREQNPGTQDQKTRTVSTCSSNPGGISLISGDPNPQCLLKGTVQMGGALRYKWEVYCWVCLSSKLRSVEGTAIKMGSVLPYKLEGVLQYFLQDQ